MPTDGASPFASVLAISPDSFAYDLDCHLRFGFVVSTPEFFLMARPVSTFWTMEMLHDPRQIDPTGNCWWLWAMSGNWRKAALHCTALYGWREWLGFDRRDKPRLVQAKRLLASELH